MVMIRKLYFFLTSFCFICFLAACSSKPTPKSPESRAALSSNTLLSPSDVKANAYLPLTSSLVSDIRSVGGEVYQSGSFVTLVVPSDALFEPNTSVLLLHKEALIFDVAKIIARFPGENVIITAHTDDIGSEFSQAKLTRDRAQLFAMVLWQQDEVDLKMFQRFKYAGMGNTQAITEDSSPVGQALNRRIQITIYPTKDMEQAYRELGNPDLNQI